MWQNIERVRIDAKPKAIWDVVADVPGHHRIAGSGELLSVTLEDELAPQSWFVSTHRPEDEDGEVFTVRNRFEVVDPPSELRWVSFPPRSPSQGEEHQLEATWWFRLRPLPGETEVEHGFRLPNPRAGMAEIAALFDRTGRMRTIAAGMRRTLENIRQSVAS